MKFSSYLKLVEIQTKVASVIPLVIGTLYAVAFYEYFNTLNLVLFSISLLCIDMATTAINNYMDYKKAFKRFGYGYEVHNAIVRDGMKEGVVQFVIVLLLIAGMTFGVLLVSRTDYIIFILGVVSFGVGVLYSFGPIPISRTPFGELFSGVFMGFLIPFIAIYIHLPSQHLVSLMVTDQTMSLSIKWLEIITILLATSPLIVAIANIMLANNLCDIDEDMANKRYTLPVYIGSHWALSLFQGLYLIGYLAILILILSGFYPLWMGLYFITLIPVGKNIRRFKKIQSKAETFKLSVINFILQGASYSILLLFHSLFQR
jgi:1,4-dihydroxy-2-naphthoate octaprenyltransferase